MIKRRPARSWPIAERAADMARSDLMEFSRLVGELPVPAGPFLVPNSAGEFVYVSRDPFAPKPRRRWWWWLEFLAALRWFR